MRSLYFVCRPNGTTPSGSSFFAPMNQASSAVGASTENGACVPVPYPGCTVVEVNVRFDTAYATGETVAVVLRKSSDNGDTWADVGTAITVGDGTGKNTAATVYSSGSIAYNYAPGDLLVVELDRQGGATAADKLAVTLVIECPAGQILFGRADLGASRTAHTDIALGTSAVTSSGETYGLRSTETGRLRHFIAWADGDGQWSTDFKTTDAWDNSGEVTTKSGLIEDNTLQPGASPAAARNDTYEYRIGANELGKAMFFDMQEDSPSTGAYLAASCVFVPDRPGVSIYSIRHTQSGNNRYFWIAGGNAGQSTTESQHRAPMPTDDFIVRNATAVNDSPPAGMDVDADLRIDGASILNLSPVEADPIDHVYNDLSAVDRTDGGDVFTIRQGVTSDSGTNNRWIAWSFQDRDAYVNGTDITSGYIEASVVPKHQPDTTESDYTFFYDLSHAPQELWAACTETTNGLKFVVNDKDGNALPFDAIDVDFTNETGILAIKDDLLSTGVVGIQIEPALSGNTAYATPTSAYKTGLLYHPLTSDGNDRSSTGLDLTSYGTAAQGYSPGPLGDAADFDGVDQYMESTSNYTLGSGGEASISCLFKRTEKTSGENIVRFGQYLNPMGVAFDATADEDIQGQFRTSAGTYYPTGSVSVAALGEWQHAVVKFDSGDTTGRMYINGVLTGSQVLSGTLDASSVHMAIAGGWSTAGADQKSVGHVISAKEALSAGWIAAMSAMMLDNKGFWGTATLNESATGDYCSETCDAPSADISDFPVLIDLSKMATEWWSAVTLDDDSEAAHYIRCTDSSGNILPVDVIEFDSTAKTGVIRVRTDLASAGSNTIRVYPPSNTAYQFMPIDGPKGQWATYDATCLAYLADGREERGRSYSTTISGTVVSASGQIGDASDFDGSSHVEVDGTEVSHDITTVGTWGVMAWARPDSLSGNYEAVIGKGNTSPLLYKNSGDKWEAWHRNSTPAWATSGNTTSATAATFDHVGALWDGSNVKCFVDGSQSGSSTSESTADGTGETTEPLFIGAKENGLFRFSGYLQHVFYYREPPSADHYATEHASGADQAAFWNFTGSWTWSGAAGGAPNFIPEQLGLKPMGVF